MKKGFGFIGCGNMGGALAKAVALSIKAENVLLNNRSAEKAEALSLKIGASLSTKEEIIATSKFVMLGVKPQNLEELLYEIKRIKDQDLKEKGDCGRQIFVTMAAAKTMDFISSILGGDTPVIRIMPNMPVSIGEGIVITAINEHVTDEEYREFADSMKYCGTVDLVDEKIIDNAMSISGCGPAYVYMMIEAMRDAGIRLGIPEKTAYEYAVKTMSGSVDLLMKTGQEVSALRESICSPGGTTIEGVNVLRNENFDEMIYKALKAAADKVSKM